MGGEAGLKYDAEKPRMSLVLGGFARALVDVSEIGTAGAVKYCDNGWMTVPGGKERYTDALLRHLFAALSGEEVDKDSKQRHLAHVAWNALAVLELHRGESNDGKV